jgi:hypothetical protein
VGFSLSAGTDDGLPEDARINSSSIFYETPQRVVCSHTQHNCFLRIGPASFFVVRPLSVASAQSLPFLQNHQLYDRGEDIRSLQSFLNSHGFLVAQAGAGSVKHDTSIFGLKTYRTLTLFQASENLPATGFFGPLTRARIVSLSVMSSGSAPSQSSLAQFIGPAGTDQTGYTYSTDGGTTWATEAIYYNNVTTFLYGQLTESQGLYDSTAVSVMYAIGQGTFSAAQIILQQYNLL